MFSLELSRRFAGTQATSNCVHPGSVETNIFRSATRRSSRPRKTPAQGAATVCYLAADPALSGVSGYYFVDCNPEEPSVQMQDPALAKKLRVKLISRTTSIRVRLARMVSLAINNIALSKVRSTPLLYAERTVPYVFCVALREIRRNPIKSREKTSAACLISDGFFGCHAP